MPKLRVPTGELPYSEALAITQDWIAGDWEELADTMQKLGRGPASIAEARDHAKVARARAEAARAIGGAAWCHMR